MYKAFFVSDLHGSPPRYQKLFSLLKDNPPDLLFFGGDLLNFRNPQMEGRDFITGYFIPEMIEIKNKLQDKYPEVFLIPGNDDPRNRETDFIDAENYGVWTYLNSRKASFREFQIYGYPFVPPTPFRLKDWEKYDVSRFVDPGSIPPDEGFRTAEPDYDPSFDTIAADLKSLTGNDDLSRSVFLFHSPPYQSNLDRAALDGMKVDHIPLDVHVGSIAIKRFIEERNPLITLHGHIHESSSITGVWKEKLGSTWMLSAAYDKPELAVICLDLNQPENAERFIL